MKLFSSLFAMVVVFVLCCSVHAETLAGTWRSTKWSHQSHTFKSNGDIVFDEGNRKNTGSIGKYRRNGQEMEWQVKWKTGSYTNWTGVILSNNTMKVRFFNNWDKGTGDDILVRE